MRSFVLSYNLKIIHKFKSITQLYSLLIECEEIFISNILIIEPFDELILIFTAKLYKYLSGKVKSIRLEFASKHQYLES